jgi:hypothetical protein
MSMSTIQMRSRRAAAVPPPGFTPSVFQHSFARQRQGQGVEFGIN